MASIPEQNGLSAAEAALRLARLGPNALPGRVRRTWRHIALDAAREPMFLLLVGGGVLYLFLGDLLEGLFLFAMVLVIIGMTLYQEGKTERALDALRDLGSPRALVLRDGAPLHIDSRNVVPGDVLVLSEGDRVPADGVLLEGAEVEADESLLTGESAPVSKEAGPAPDPAPRPGGDGTSLLYSGTLLVHGHGLVLVTATGSAAEIGRIGQALAQIAPESSPLQKQFARLVATFAVAGTAMSLLLVLLYGLRTGDWLESLLAGIALAMSMLPVEFTVVLTVFPALGAWRLARANVLTRRLAAIETLGATSVLCVDKTGTLTENRMQVRALYAAGHTLTLDDSALKAPWHELARHAILASSATPFDPMELAIHRLGVPIPPGLSLAREYPLSPQLRAMTQAWQCAGEPGYIVAAKGAPEALISLCALEGPAADAVRAATEAMAQQGLRVLGVGSATWQGELPMAQPDFAFAFVGLVALADPLRADITAAVAECRAAGVRVVMITGDYPATAAAIASQAGIDVGAVLGGDELDRMQDAELRERLRGTGVCARIAPEQKLRIVQALKAGGAIVGMTGDGVNDAPALRAAHVGIAMGRRGTDVARESAALVLLDDRFSSIVHALRLGRRIFQNMQKSMSYILGVHVTVAGMALIPVLLGWPVLLYPMHIVFLELMIDPACALAFENEPAEPKLMTMPPRHPGAALLGGWTLAWAAMLGLVSLLAVLAAYGWAVATLPEGQARAFGFASLVAANIAQIFTNRSHTRSVLQGLQTPNHVVWVVAGAALAMLLVAMYQPLLAGLFRFTPLALPDLAMALAIGTVSIAWFEALKLLRQARTWRR